ncbi:hypothetical protein AJ78_06532 [Emergomyces pasteurianus Ep9510]|uniref:Uncharacterized protein n=1 Tax=Emergomyces pasteurianus Ep9510 TaxID=1447872 RepID=A0A1J9P8X8_9EURO|nr:hypothetical protein AJ78_06532 [Emergomyces pasteurianus Ep9510]
MEYNVLSQSDDHDEIVSDTSASDRSESPPQPHRRSFQRLTLDADNLGGSGYMNVARIGDQPNPSLVGSVIRSLGPASTSSYDILDEDDYDATAAIETPMDNSSTRANHNNNNTDSRPSSSPNTNHTRSNNSGSSSIGDYHQHAIPSPPAEPLIHSPVSAHPVPLCHPTPDLQSLQGAYVGNVERLEKSAETLSSTSDIGEELRKLQREQTRLSSDSIASWSAVDPHPLRPGSPVRKFSTSSLSNSIIGLNNSTRSGIYSPGGYLTSSAKGSVMSASSAQGAAAPHVRSVSVASRLAQVPEPVNEDQPTQFHETRSDAPILSPPETPQQDFIHNEHPQRAPIPHHPQPTYNENVPEERPITAGSTDTYKQSTSLFNDFDGVHFTPFTREGVLGRRVSLTKPPLARESKPFKNPPPGQNMVFYPAPVPMVLNLPPKRSKRPADPQREKHRSQLINSLPAETRKSVGWLLTPEPEENSQESTETRNTKRLSEIPPQLRATAFFEQPPVTMDVQIKQNSAVATLDSILDAAALAPVSAFTDHPIVGHVGAEVYGKPRPKKKLKPLAGKKGKRNSRNSLGARDSIMPSRNGIRTIQEEGGNETEGRAAEGSDEVTPFRESYEGDHDRVGTNLRNGMEREQNEERNKSRLGIHENSSEDDDEVDGQQEEEEEEEDEEEEEEEETYVGAPTTLLAELQMRKQEQKQRNRTAATAFPNGMHSTLLELDAVAQHQRKTRNQKHITLAWEDPGVAERNEPDDEDVPLAVLFPKNLQSDDNRPMGLMEKLQLEENEPLSHRRARIRGGPFVVGEARNSAAPMARASTVFLPDDNINGNGDGEEEEEEEEEEEGETLAQRARRLKAEEANVRISRDFTNELLNQFGALSTDEPRSSSEQAKDQQQQPPPPPVAEEETLGQRRRRLQAEKAAAAATAGATGTAEYTVPTPIAKQRHSMASVLQAHPARNGGNNPYLTNGAGAGAGIRHSHQPLTATQQIRNRMPMNMNMMQQQQQQHYAYTGKSTKYGMNLSSHANAGHGSMGYGYGNVSGMGNGMQYSPMMGMNNLGTGMAYGNGYGYGYPDAHMVAAAQQGEPIIDPGQRDLIDRWRQSVRY